MNRPYLHRVSFEITLTVPLRGILLVIAQTPTLVIIQLVNKKISCNGRIYPSFLFQWSNQPNCIPTFFLYFHFNLVIGVSFFVILHTFFSAGPFYIYFSKPYEVPFPISLSKAFEPYARLDKLPAFQID